MGVTTQVLAGTTAALIACPAALAGRQQTPSARFPSEPAKSYYICQIVQTAPKISECAPLTTTTGAYQEDTLQSPASLNKIMTALLILQHMRENNATLDTPFVQLTPVDDALGRRGERNGKPITDGHILTSVPRNHTFTYREAILALTVYSANNVAIASARKIAPDGSIATFIKMMNATAQKIGMSKTRLLSPSGMPATGQVTTAKDMAKLIGFFVQEYGIDTFREYFGQTSTQISGIKIPGHIRLLDNNDFGLVGAKSGTDAAGLNLAGLAVQDGCALSFSTLGSPPGPKGKRALFRDMHLSAILKRIFSTMSCKPIETPPTPTAQEPAQAIKPETPLLTQPEASISAPVHAAASQPM